MGESAAFELQDVSRRYGRRWALARLSFTLQRGSSLLLTGHNGSGKTTLLKLLATSLRPTVGKARVLGHDVVEDREQVRERTALLSHASYLYEDLSARQNLHFLAELLGVPKAKDVTAALLDRVGLGQRADAPIRQFSAGMRKRLAIARLLLKKPDLALLDEPFGELDPDGISQMEGFIKELIAQGSTIVLATHLIEQGQSLCKERLHLSEGRVAAP
ncbi:MAG: heme ABC exporter ATP-binding protein CcmA [Myxococcaceae bacterium]